MFNRQTQGKLQMINRGNNLLGLEITPAFSYAIPPLLKILTQVQTHSIALKNIQKPVLCFITFSSFPTGSKSYSGDRTILKYESRDKIFMRL